MALADGGTAPAAGTASAETDRRRLVLATVLFVTWVVLGVYLAMWLSFDGSRAAQTWTTFKTLIESPTSGQWYADLDKVELRKCLALAQTNDAAGQRATVNWSGQCEEMWQRTWFRLRPAPRQHSDGVPKMLQRHFWTRYPVNLIGQFGVALAAGLILFFAVGLGTNGLWLGALVDDQKRYSLARLQQIVWTVVIMGGLAVTAIFNAGMLMLPIRESVEYFPSIPGALWAALGINLLASPYLSLLIKDTKQGKAADQPGAAAAGAPPPVTPTDLVRPAKFFAHTDIVNARWLDLVTGEAEGAQRNLDLSRVQHLIISGLLVVSYMMMLAKMLVAVTGQAIATAMLQKASIFQEFPAVSDTFVYLLVLSHAGYLVFKANATEKGGTESEARVARVDKLTRKFAGDSGKTAELTQLKTEIEANEKAITDATATMQSASTTDDAKKQAKLASDKAKAVLAEKDARLTELEHAPSP